MIVRYLAERVITQQSFLFEAVLIFAKLIGYFTSLSLLAICETWQELASGLKSC